MKQVGFIVKGNIKNKEKLLANIHYEIKRFFENKSPENTPWEYTITETTHQAHAIELACKMSKTHQILVAVGGDGTLNEVINGIMLSNTNDLPLLGLLPSGTANDFARTLRIKHHIPELIKKISQENIRTLDIGKVEYSDIKNQPSTRYFMNIADIGLGGLVVKKVNESSKWLGSNITFLKTVTTCMLTYKKTSAICKDNNSNIIYEGKVMSLVAANGKCFGSGLCIAPDADPGDGLLEIVVLGNISMWDYIKNVGKVKKGKKVLHPEVRYIKGNYLKIVHSETQIPLDVDGEYCGSTPVTFSIEKQKIHFLI